MREVAFAQAQRSAARAVAEGTYAQEWYLKSEYCLSSLR